jgi:hypothetical protein
MLRPRSRRQAAQEKLTLKPYQTTHPSPSDGQAGMSAAGEAMASVLAAESVGAALVGVGAGATEDGVAMAGDGPSGSGSAWPPPRPILIMVATTTPAIMLAITAAATAVGEEEKSPAGALRRRGACLQISSEGAVNRPSYT